MSNGITEAAAILRAKLFAAKVEHVSFYPATAISDLTQYAGQTLVTCKGAELEHVLAGLTEPSNQTPAATRISPDKPRHENQARVSADPSKQRLGDFQIALAIAFGIAGAVAIIFAVAKFWGAR